MYCGKCGAEVKKDSKFCPSCGEVLNESGNKNQSVKSEENSKNFQASSNENAEFTKTAQPTAVNLAKNNENTENYAQVQDNSSVNQMQNEYTQQPETAYNGQNINDDSTETDEKYDDMPTQPTAEKVRVGAARKLAAGILVPITAIFLVLMGTFISVKFGVKGDEVSKAVESVKTDTLFDEKAIDSKTLAQYIYGEMNQKFISKHNVKEENIENFIEKSDLKSYIADVTGKYADLVLQGKGKAAVSAEDISGFLKDNEGVIESEFGYKMQEKDYADIEKQFDEMEETKPLLPSNWKSEYGFDFRNIYIYMYVGMIASAIVAVLLMIWQSKILCGNPKSMTNCYGTEILISGIIMVLFAIGMMIIKNSEKALLLTIAGAILKPSALLFGAVGGAEIIVGAVNLIIHSKIKKTEARSLH